MKEYACTIIDVLARRTRLAFLDVQAAEEAIPRIAEIMAKELNWNKSRRKVWQVPIASEMATLIVFALCYQITLMIVMLLTKN